MSDGGQKVTHLTVLIGPPKKNQKNQFPIRTSSQLDGSRIALEWRQRTFTFVRYDYGCPLLSLCTMRKICAGVPPSLAGPVLLLLPIRTSCPTSLGSSLPGSWFYFCPSLQALHSAYFECTDESHI